jgi:hypothetical protein
LVKLDTWTFCYLQKYPVINKSQKTKKKFSLKVLVFALLFTVLFSSAFAQTLSVPSYSVNRIKSGYVYTFFIKTNQIVRYRVFDSFTGKISVGSAMNGESLVISYNDTVVAWTETAAGTKSREIMLGKNAVQNAISRKFEIISPVEGTWANRQPLVLDCAPETEVYYSFSGYDPLEFGFAYDGPVLIDLNGNITLNLVAVHGDGSITRKTVSYIVNEPVAVKPPLYLSALNPLVICGVEKPVPISQNLTYGIGSHLDASLRGRTLYQTLPSCVNVLLPLEITSGSSVYRYIITTGDAPKTTMIQDKTFSSPIQIIDWNFVLFKADQKLQYSVDGGDWQVYLEPFYLDRTKSHTIRWRTGSKIESLVLPEKPTIIGIPDRNLTNKSVELQFSNPLYTFRIEDIHGVSKPLTSFYADTLAGDERLFDLQLAVYYGNIRQGEISVSFTIDKLPPPAPVLILEDESEYEKCSAVISIYSKEDVFTAIGTNVTSLDFGETSLLYAQNAEPDESAMFMPFAGSRLILGNGDTNEIYTVYAYAQDLAGNKSDTVAVRTQSVFNNVYVDSSSLFAFEADGSPTKPFSSINDAIDVINSRKKTILHLKGSFNIPQNITISSDCSFMGHENVCLSFKNNASLIIRNANVSFENCMFEKNTEQDIRFLLSAGAPLIDARDSKLFLENCKLVSNSSMPQGLIHAVKCYLETDSNNIAVQSLSQAVGVQCLQSNVRSKNDRFSLSGEYAVAFILSDSAFELDSPRFILAAKQAGCVELFACVYSFEENVLKNEIHTSKDFIPFKIDSSSQKGIAPLF